MTDEQPPPYASAVTVELGTTEEKRRDPTQHGNEYSGLNNDEGAPPSYSTANNDPPEYSNDPPPTYDSVVRAKVQQMRDESSGNADFAKKMFCAACCGTVATIIFIAISIAFPLASLVIGSIYVHDCPRERYIPIFLIVSGVFGVLRGLGSSIHAICNRKKQEEEDSDEKKKANPFDGVVGCFLFAWTIAGSVWIYRIYKDYQSVDPTKDDYCHQTLYLYAFWSLTVGYIMVAVMICCGCGCAGIAMCVAGSSKQPGNAA